MIEIILAGIFLLLIPVNIDVALETNRIARIKPYIPLVVLVGRLVTLLALGACVFGLFSTAAVLRLLTGIVLLPQPIGALVAVGMALLLSAANLLVRRYLREKRRPFEDPGALAETIEGLAETVEKTATEVHALHEGTAPEPKS